MDQDYTKSVYFYGLAAAQGNPAAQCNLGYLIGQGHGTSKDPQKEAALYQKAADQGYANAQFNLGKIMRHYCLSRSNFDQVLSM